MACLFAASSRAQTTPSVKDLGLREFIGLVLERNESVQERILEYEINRKHQKAEQGAFEPELALSYNRVENLQENTAQQRLSQRGLTVFNEKNNIYDGGLEALVPTGARIRLGYTLHDLRNNLQDPAIGNIITNGGREYQTFVGLSLSQPLLKNAWTSATFANIRLAALASDVAFQEYRRQLTAILATAEATYWNLYLAQEQVRFFQDSVALAEGLVRDGRTKVEAGKGSDLDVLQAEAGLALRRSKLVEARQKYRETAAQLRTLISLRADAEDFEFRASDQPDPSGAIPSFQECSTKALRLNPDYLGQQKKLAQEDVKVAYARNQRLPQLDLKASFGLNGLGSSPAASWDKSATTDFPSMSIGLEMRIPLEGGIRSRNELAAARLKKRQALLQFQELETQVINGVKTALFKVQNASEAVENYRAVVGYDEDLLKTQLARLEVGKVESRKVLEVEAELFEAKNAVAEALVQHERARLELVSVEGALLETRHVELTPKELQRKTVETFRSAGGSDKHFQELLQELKLRYVPGGKPTP